VKLFEKKRFRREFDRIVTLLDLDKWEIDFSWCDPMDDDWANVRCNDQKDEAIIEFGTDLLDRPWERQRDTIVHELMHLHTRDLRVGVWRQLGELDITLQARALVRDSFTRHEEQLVDRLAHVVTPLVS
jgi:hypothetical protein